MPSKSRKQQKFIFAKRAQYKTKKDTPEKWKWVWEKDWEKIEEKLLYKYFEAKGAIMEIFFDDLEKQLKRAKTFEDLAIVLSSYGGSKPAKIEIGLKIKELADMFGNDFKKAKTYAFKELTKRRGQYFTMGS